MDAEQPPSTIMSRLMAKSQKVEEDEGERRAVEVAFFDGRGTDNDMMEAMMGQLPIFGAGAASGAAGGGGGGGGAGGGGGGRSMMMSGLMNRSSGSLAGEPVAHDEDDGEGLESAFQPKEETAAVPEAAAEREGDGAVAAAAQTATTGSSMLAANNSINSSISINNNAEPEHPKPQLMLPKQEAEPVFDENVAEGDKYLAAAEVDEYGVPKMELYCMCQQAWNPNRFMVACDGCDEWYHDTCLGMAQEELEKLDRFMCMWCIERDKRREARRKQHEADRTAKAVAKKARQAQRKREQQNAAKRARTKPCKNTSCTQRARPQSKYCSEECGLEVAAALHHEREVKRIQEAVQSAIAQQEADLRQWTEAHPNFLSECTDSIATAQDLQVILAAMEEVKRVKERLPLAEAIVAEQTAAAKSAEVRRPGSIAAAAPGGGGTSGEAEHRLDCAVCGKDVPTTSYVGHLRECMHRNDEFAHSTVSQNPSLCNMLSRRTNRYCSMPKGQCTFHTPGSQIDYQFLVCGYNDCQTPALQCLKHADWREASVKVARLSLKALQDKLAALEERVALAKQRIASREMALERGAVKVIDERKK